MADCDIFREQLAIKYPLYGHALWEPSPRDPDKPVQVGDVGFIRKGKFHRLFNALLPADDPSHDCGVPEYHEPLVPYWTRHLDGVSLDRNHYCSAGVSVEPDPGYHSRPGDIPQVTFKYNRTHGAAVLSLPVTARREDTLALGDFKLWIVKHIDNWFAFARKLGLGIERMEEITLVTGCDRTKSWANIAFLGNQDDSQVSFGVRAESPDHGITFQFSPENARGAVLRHGPQGENLPENQCVFIRGYRVARSFWILPRRLKAAAGPSSDPGGYDCDPDMEVISIPAITKYRDPLYLLLDYVAEQASGCDMVLVHDDDLAEISGLGHDSSLDALEPDVMKGLLRRSNMDIQVFETDSGPNTNMSIVKVAMLSMTSQHWDIGANPGRLKRSMQDIAKPVIPRPGKHREPWVDFAPLCQTEADEENTSDTMGLSSKPAAPQSLFKYSDPGSNALIASQSSTGAWAVATNTMTGVHVSRNASSNSASTDGERRWSTEEDAIRAKRLQNTLAARKSRKRRLEFQRQLENAIEAQRMDKEMQRCSEDNGGESGDTTHERERESERALERRASEADEGDGNSVREKL